MADDDMDLDLELDTETGADQPPKRGLFSRRPKPAPAPKKTAPAAPAAPGPAKAAQPAAPSATGAESAQRPVTVMPARRPGLLARLFSPVSAYLGRLHAPTWNFRNFVLGLLILALVVVVVENWPPMRLSFLGLHADLPKSLVLVIVFAVGFLLGWLPWRRRASE